MPYSPTPWFFLGPLGRLVALPAPEPGIDNGLVKHAAQHVSLNAHTTEDVQGFRREWSITMSYLDRDDVSYLEACYVGAIDGPLRLVDPTRRNRLSAAASAASVDPTWSGGTTAFTATSGAVVVDRSATPPPLTYDAADSRTVTYRPSTTLAWNLSGGGTLTLDSATAVPVLPGETITASAYVQTDGPTATLEIIPRTAADDREPVAGTSTSGDTWQRVTATYTPNDDAIVAVVPRLSTADAAGTVRVAAAQVEPGGTAASWVLGTGCPEVLVTELSATSPLYPLVTAKLALREV